VTATPVQRFALAARTATFGRTFGDPVLLVAAARLRRTMRLEAGASPKIVDAMDAPLPDGPLVDARPDVDRLVADARRVADAEKQLIDDLIREIDSAWPKKPQPIASWSGTIAPGQAARFRIAAGGEIAIAGDGRAPVVLSAMIGGQMMRDERALRSCAYMIQDWGTDDAIVDIGNLGRSASAIVVAWHD